MHTTAERENLRKCRNGFGEGGVVRGESLQTHSEPRQSGADRVRKCKLECESECLGRCQGEAEAKNVDLWEPHANLEDWDGSLSRTLSQSPTLAPDVRLRPSSSFEAEPANH